MTGTQYTLRVVNNSTNFVDMCVFQDDPDIGVPDVMSLAWFAKPTYPTTTVVFRWTVDYSFIWSETGTLKPGVFFDASQSWPADPSIVGVSSDVKPGNQIGFAHPSPSAYTFISTPTPGAQAGSLYIKQDQTVPLKRASVGIGMSGSGTFAVQAQPNMNLNFSPHPAYYLAAGTYTQGEVLDIGSISNPAEIRYPAGVFSLTAVLQEDNTWQIEPTSKSNAMQLKRVITDRRSVLVGSRN
jgi:rhizosphere induced protein